MNLSFLCVDYLFIISHGFIYLFIYFVLQRFPLAAIQLVLLSPSV